MSIHAYISNNNNTLIFWTVFVFVLTIMIDPTNSFGLKIPLFALTLISWSLLHSKISKDCCIFLFFEIFYVVYGILISHIHTVGQNIIDSYQVVHIQLLFMSLLILPMSKLSKVDIFKINYVVGIILASFIDILYLIYTSNPEIESLMYAYIQNSSEVPTILISRRNFLGFDILAFFYKTSPFLFFSAIYKWTNIRNFKDVLLGIILISPIFLTGSRTPMICGLCILLFAFYVSPSISRNLKIIVLISSFITGIILVQALFTTSSDGSIETKGGNMQLYIRDIFNIKYMFSGWGIGSTIIDVHGRAIAYNEITYLDILRMWGIIFGCAYIMFLFYPIKTYFQTYNRNVKSFVVAYVLYLILGATNPFIFASTGWYILIATYCISFENQKRHIRNLNYGVRMPCNI